MSSQPPHPDLPGDDPGPGNPSPVGEGPPQDAAAPGSPAVNPAGRTAVGAAFLSALVPGAGHWLSGRVRRGLWFFLPSANIVAAGLVFALAVGRAELAAMAVQLQWLWAFLAVNLVLAGIRVAATADAYRVGRPPRAHRWIGPTALAAALAVTVSPHVVVASHNLGLIDTLETVFDPPSTTATTDPDAYAGPVLGTTTTTLPPPTTTTTIDPTQWTVPPFTLPESSLPEEEFLPLEELAEGRYLSVLLAGGDAGPGRGGLRTDTMIVATFDLEMDKAYLFGISRELVHIPLPSGWDDAFEDLEDELWRWELTEWIRDQDKRCRRGSVWKDDPPDFCPPLPVRPERCECFPDRLNAIYTYTRNWTRTWPDVPDPGMEAVRQAMSTLLAIPIDYYVLVDMAGFVALVDALGGVDVWVKSAVHQGFSPAVEGGPIVRVDVEPGWAHLDGSQALAYVRDRTNSSDIERIRRQRCMLRSVAAAADPVSLIWRFGDLLTAIRDNTTTNVPLDFLPELVRAAAALDLQDIVTVSLTGSGYYDGQDFRGIPMPDLPDIRWRVRSVLEGSAPGSSEGEDDECGEPLEH